MCGPRSLTRTTTDLPLARFVTRATLPRGRVLYAAESSSMSKISPLAVRLPWRRTP
jgi:hypothetical protein